MGSVVLVAALAFAGSAQAALYWTNGGGVARSNTDGSMLDGEFIPASQDGPFVSYAGCEDVAVNASHIYWSEPGRGAIARANLDGTGAEYNFILGLNNPCGVALDGTSIYWAEDKGGTIGRAGLEGNEVDRKFVSGVTNPCGVAVGGGYLYWTSDTDFSLYRMPLSGASPQRLYKGDGSFELCGVALDSAHVYWGGFGNSIGRAQLDGSDPEPSFITGIERPCGIALQGSRIYWTENSAPGAIQGTDLEGAHEVQTIVDHPGDPCGIAADSLTLTPPPSPPVLRHTISFKRVRYSGNSPATFLRVKFWETGSFTVRTGHAVKWRVLPNSSALTLPSEPEERWLKLWPAAGSPSAKALRARLRRKGRAPIVIKVRFVAPDGAVSNGSKRLPLVDRRQRR